MHAKRKVNNEFGLQAVAELMNNLDEESRERLLKVLREKDPSAFAKVRDRMFTFEEIAQLPDEQIRALIQKFPQSQIALALRKSSVELKAAFLRNMSKAAGENLTQTIEEIGPQKVSLVEWAQQEMIKAVTTPRGK